MPVADRPQDTGEKSKRDWINDRQRECKPDVARLPAGRTSGRGDRRLEYQTVGESAGRTRRPRRAGRYRSAAASGRECRLVGRSATAVGNKREADTGRPAWLTTSTRTHIELPPAQRRGALLTSTTRSGTSIGPSHSARVGGYCDVFRSYSACHPTATTSAALLLMTIKLISVARAS